MAGVLGAAALVLQLVDRRAKLQATVGQPRSSRQAAPAAPIRAALYYLLPAHLGSGLICLENEDHYIRAHTAEGSSLILMRMRDAAAHLASEDGERVHRGWWVARRAVVEVVRRDRAVTLRLVNGLEAPVARAIAPQLRDRG